MSEPVTIKHHSNPRMSEYGMVVVEPWTICWSQGYTVTHGGHTEKEVGQCHPAIELMNAQVERRGCNSEQMTAEEEELWETLVGGNAETALREP